VVFLGVGVLRRRLAGVAGAARDLPLPLGQVRLDARERLGLRVRAHEPDGPPVHVPDVPPGAQEPRAHVEVVHGVAQVRKLQRARERAVLELEGLHE